ncbi:probable phospholipid-transporting ATPase IF isoform X4 [Hermetia illucens]|uniref:probable phospholipid-transporting ATPase IF isoform X3 n=1 Tax=Hermetia illucens TaxID=343691 RepID=UPI0018CC04F2|nr:probable phospholipid-transporting ATPase IF isoform X3 [Hermetia illucens]XP_037918795.1 probable phospholipid-transporting ATPase IF isoform X4 [Hermetia illucens]XP_037918796.1 probable phospholipid-transporting ATPase IF isoform X4 [Hermetia illucens]
MGNRVSTEDGPLTIKIGGDPANRNKKEYKHGNRIKSTKYNLITFLPQNLLEQFRRIANFYFLVLVIISLIIDSPVSPYTSLIPLMFVIVVTATKQGYEDFLRHKADNMVNFSLVTVIREGKEEDINCQDIIRGDLVLVSRDCDVPCDLVLLKSSDPNGRCFVTTANLDGETNLKSLTVPKHLPNVEVEKLHTLGLIEYEQPKTDLYSFNGKIELAGSYRVHSPYMESASDASRNVIPLMNENLLLRGSRVKNTEQVIGCAVYTGQNTKLALNSRLTRNKVASSESYINKFLIFTLIVLLALVTVSYFIKRYYDMYVIEYYTYLGPPPDEYSVASFFQDYFSFLILFNYLIPISLYVTIEMNKFLGAFFLEWDVDLYDEKTDQPCIVNTSDLNEELGQINILFSDKTGTLTKNEMSLQQCSIKGRKYKFNGPSIQEERAHYPFKLSAFNTDQREFFQALALCHTVQVGGSATEEGDSEELVQSVYTFADIKEESSGSNRADSELDEPDSVQLRNAPRSPEMNDINPLLGKSSTSNANRRRTETFERRSPVTGTRAQENGRLPRDIANERPTTMPSILSRPEIRRVFFRSTSSIEELTGSHSQQQTHRRTQSYGAQSAYQRQTTLVRRSASLRRNPSVRSRESYAMPSFIGGPIYTAKVDDRQITELKALLDKLDYQASSPDEKALVEACANLGIYFVGEENDILTLNIASSSGTVQFGQYGPVNQMFYKRLHVLEFNSDRKRMSVILQDQKGEVWVYTKGAESYVFPLCDRKSEALINETNKHLTDFSRQGLRTLAIARRKMSTDEYKEIFNELVKANSALVDRQKLLDAVYVKIERDLELLGATAVEDALQDNVRETLIALQEAGIKVWVLTGDKVETAHNIALSCGHIPEDSETYFITECRDGAALWEHLRVLDGEIKRRPNEKCSLLIDGKSLGYALSDHPDKFREVSVKCKAVLCCRLSPLQKSQVVKLVKKSKDNYITAAIGDGANDVSMIQEAHVGLGIVGKEGRQAARCADYAFATFCMLQRLLLVHGHYYSRRLSILVLYFFYKNGVFMGIQFFFQFNNLFSATSIYDSLFLTLYNVIYTAVPILVLSLTEKPYKENILMMNPKLYKKNIYNHRLHWKFFIGWMLLAVYHSIILYVFAYYIWSRNNAILTTPHTVSFTCFGTFIVHNVVILVNMKLWLEAIYQSYIFIATIWLSILAFIISTMIYNIIVIPYDSEMYWVYIVLLSSITVWLLSLCSIITCLVPDFLIIVCNRAFRFHVRIFPGRESRGKSVEFKAPMINHDNSDAVNGNYIQSTSL